jgi:hypothetical protein
MVRIRNGIEEQPCIAGASHYAVHQFETHKKGHSERGPITKQIVTCLKCGASKTNRAIGGRAD